MPSVAALPQVENPSLQAIYRYAINHRAELSRPSDDESPDTDWLNQMGERYKVGGEKEKLSVLASVWQEISRWDAITRSAFLLPAFERAAGSHISAFWD